MATAPQTPETRKVTVTHLSKTRVTGREAVTEYLELAAQEKRTGSLTIHFSQGVPGCVEWMEKLSRE